MKIDIFLFILLILFFLGHSENAGAEPATDWSQIAIVWPHDLKGQYAPVGQSSQVNISVWPRTQVACNQSPNVTLWIAKDNQPSQPSSVVPQTILRTINGITFPSLEFNNIPTDFSNSSSIYHFALFDTVPVSNVWTHATTSRANYPTVNSVGFKELSEPYPSNIGVDARIKSVQPHDGQGNSTSIGEAPLLDVQAEYFLHNTLNLIGAPNLVYGGPYLLVAEGNEILKGTTDPFGKIRFGNPEYPPHIASGRTWYPKIVYKNVQVKPQTSYQLAIGNYSGVATYTSFWTYASDIRTSLPAPSVPPACIK